MGFVAALVPINPTRLPGFTGVQLMGLGPEFVEGLEVAFGFGGFGPFDFGFDEVEEVFGKTGREDDGLLEVLAGLGAVADARRPAGAVAIKQAEIAVRSGVVERSVGMEDEDELGFHLAHELESAKGLGLGKFAHVHAEIIVALHGVGVGGEKLLGGGDALFGDVFSAGVGGLEIGEIKGRARELPKGGGVVGVGIEAAFGGGQGFFGALDENGIGGVIGAKTDHTA